MELLYISSFMFKQDGETTFGLPSCSDSFFQKYLDVFDGVRVLGEKIKHYLNEDSLVQIRDKRITVRIIESNTHPKDFINDAKVKRVLEEEVSKAEAILIKPSSRKGMMAIKIAKKMNKPYMIEMTGDIHNALKQNPNLLKKMYAPILYSKIKRSISDCRYGLYVSEYYLQQKYPISGLAFGCSDVVLDESNNNILESRINKIKNTNFENDQIDLALIGFYQGKMKGVDCAVRALARLPINYHLHILGNGTKKSQSKWFRYANRFGVSPKRIHFPEPLPNSTEVCNWLQKMDFFVFPSRSEGFGRVVAEAMSQGLPCFVTRICTLPELIDDDCLFKINNDKELSLMIIEASKNKNKLIDISKRNFNKAKQYGFCLLKEKRDSFLHTFKQYCLSKR